jgi:hypothetical protein
MLAPNAPFVTLKFSSDSSHTTTRGMVSEASNELLSTLIKLLQCNFAIAANSEEIFSAEPAWQESGFEKKTVYIFGGSNMKNVIHLLDKEKFEIVDRTVPGWVPNPANLTQISNTLGSAAPGSMAILDLLGNVSYRYMQCDGTLALPYKMGGKYHFEGELLTLSQSTLVSILGSIKPSLSSTTCHLCLLSPLPRHLHDGCCKSAEHCTNVGKDGHAEKILGELNAIRTSCENTLNHFGIKNYSMPDLLKLMMPACIGISEYALSLKHLFKDDGVHLNADGMRCLANALTSLIGNQSGTGEKPSTVRPSNVSGPRPRTFYWRGFVSPVGTCRPNNHNKAYMQSHSSHSGRNQAAALPAKAPPSAGGKWPKDQKGKSFQFRAPYRGGPRGGKK